MTKKAVALLAMATLVLGLSACGAKEEVSEATSVTEMVQETNTSITEDIESRNLAEEKEDLSNFAKAEIPEVPEIGESIVMTEDEFNNAIAEYIGMVLATNHEAKVPENEEERKSWVGSYVMHLAESDETLQSITLGEYFGSYYDMVPDAVSKDETFKEYADAENAYLFYTLDVLIADYVDPDKYAGQKELTLEDFHNDQEMTQKWLSFDN